MNQEIFDFSLESNIQDTLLRDIKYAYFNELADSDLDCLNVAGELERVSENKRS